MKHPARRIAPRPSYRPTLEALERRDTPATFTVTSLLDNSGPSLRTAILNANANPGLDTINFNIPASGTQVLVITSPLPTITDAVTINAATQSGYAGTPVVQLDGFSAGAGANGLVLTTNGSTVFGLSITNFSGDGLVLLGGGGNSLFGNYVGLTPAGTVANNGQNGPIGVLIAGGSANNYVGVGSPNVISGNGLIGLCVYGPGANNNTVANNFIGTNPAASAALPNGMAGVDIQAGAAGNTFSANVVSGNGIFGFLIANPGTSSNIVTRNLIGLNGSGLTAIANGFAGVLLAAGTSGNTIGGGTGAAGNLISGNGAYGVFLDGPGTSGNVVGGNIIGLRNGGTAALGNLMEGVALQDGAANNLLLADTISGNASNNVSITGAGTTQNVVTGCRIGVSAAGNAAAGSSLIGVLIRGGATANLISGCTITNNAFINVYLTDAGTTANAVQGCFLGTDSTGSAVLGSQVYDVQIFKAPGNVVGGTTAASRNVIAGSTFGIVVVESTGTALVGNFIGLNAAGTAAPTGTAQLRGVEIDGGNANLIYFNVISGNTSDAILLTGANNTVFGNIIGMNASMTSSVANGTGVHLANNATGNVVGGTTAANRNVIIGNLSVGVLLDGSGTGGLSGNVIEGNTIQSNFSQGVRITGDSFNNTIGGTAAGAGNQIAYNGSGVVIDIQNAGTDVRAGTGNAIEGNSLYGNYYFGIDLGGDGVTLNGNQNTGQSPNSFLNYPVLNRVIASGSLTIIQGTYTGLNSGLYRLEFFATVVGNSSGHGEGQKFLGYYLVNYNSGVSAPFVVALDGNFSGQSISATATDALGNTSEFALNVVAT